MNINSFGRWVLLCSLTATLPSCIMAEPVIKVVWVAESAAPKLAESARSVSVTGKITWSGGSGATPIQVQIPQSPYKTQTDAQGKFTLANIPASQANRLEAFSTLGDGTHYSLSTPLSASNAILNLPDLLLRQSGSVYGLVKTQQATDLTGTMVFVPGTALVAMTDHEGNYFLPNVPPGQHTFKAQREGFAQATGDAQVESGKPTQLTLVLPAQATETPSAAAMTGSVTAQGQPLAGVLVGVRGDAALAITDRLGRFELRRVPAGKFVLQFSRTGFAYAEQEITTLPVQRILPPLELQPEQQGMGHIKGVVLDKEGQPVKAATLETQPPTITVTTNAQGEFDIPRIWPGSYYLTAKQGQEWVGSKSLSVGPQQYVTVRVQGLEAPLPKLCDQQVVNNIKIEAPGSQVSVNVNTQNHCGTSSQPH